MTLKEKLREIIFRKYDVSFSKSGEDIQLKQLLRTNTPGTYVDIGCWHPLKASNSYYFSIRDWKGICIDPNPELKKVFNNYRKNDIFINSGVSNVKANLDYFMLEESSMNTFSKAFIDGNNLREKIIKTVNIPVLPLSEILDCQLKDNYRLDFFDIDVEGLDIEVLKSNNWRKYRPKCILIETNKALVTESSSEIATYLNSKNYELIGKSVIDNNLGNLFFLNKDNQ